MSDLQKSLSVSASGMRAQATRLRHVAENIANSDTPGYQRKLVPFELAAQSGNDAGGVKTGRVQLDRSEANRIYDPSHPMADSDGYFTGSNVNTILEMADSSEAQRGYEANLKMFDQARKMSSSLLELLRR
ncbi:flagellar basal body rod protein FlgC [Meridianimarinicoccus aquatilis]|uniref:Flagellar basal-body rod protein FlgC n=1 Tax=Meridianimarinicoccus aquatilis TaxID=2552766 RepID=A0A4R6B2T3_9RHOB|nr:flagellar basal body rod protein FlgC [Fluviibacterium aquatile]QIE41230.1 flagellar basal body rod protein FlgC [Rhodobacteraceae bacterium SC52]TDL90572.1 flagellar basal body rod protein FlgC [Fluviibacterium aquatile]